MSSSWPSGLCGYFKKTYFIMKEDKNTKPTFLLAFNDLAPIFYAYLTLNAHSEAIKHIDHNQPGPWSPVISIKDWWRCLAALGPAMLTLWSKVRTFKKTMLWPGKPRVLAVWLPRKEGSNRSNRRGFGGLWSKRERAIWNYPLQVSTKHIFVLCLTFFLLFFSKQGDVQGGELHHFLRPRKR